jgi:N-acylglucosamine-6-phosphate 2-epimerase
VSIDPLLASLEGGLIVSCQAAPGSPLDSPETLAAMAKCANEAGAAGIRANHGANIAAISKLVRLPVIGIKKREVPEFEVYITPEWKDVLEVAKAGAKIIALDATARPRPGHEDFRALAKRIHEELGLMVMADISTLEEGKKAHEDGADIVATTMSGYTPYTLDRYELGPDLELVQELAKALDCPVICEGRISTPAQAGSALSAGAYAVVVGTAITAPTWIAEQFVNEMRRI